jgi:2-phospho-L-lactate guanylyltransferase
LSVIAPLDSGEPKRYPDPGYSWAVDVGILAVKELEHAKSRLEKELSEVERKSLAGALVDDALDLCAKVGRVTWWVLSADPSVLSSAADRGLHPLHDEAAGLNASLAAAVDHLVALGATSLTILPADLPLAQPEDIEDLLDTGATSSVVVVPAGARGGTNALHLRPPDALAPRFGPGSLAAHCADAENLGLRCSVLALDRLALDIDTIQDVDELVASGGPGRAYEVASSFGRSSGSS